MPLKAIRNVKPKAAISLTATADGGYTRVKLAWTDTSTARKGFEVQRSDDGSTGWAFVGSVLRENWGQSVNYYTDTGLTRGNTYYYRVRGFNDAGTGRWSNVANATIWQLSDVTLYADYDANADVYENAAGDDPCEDSDGVWVMKDQANSYDLVQATAAARPSYQTNELNGLPIIRNASGDILKASTASDWKFLHDGTEFGVYIVWKTTSTNPDALYQILDTGGQSSNDTGLAIMFDDRSSVPRVDAMLCTIGKGAGGGDYEAVVITKEEAVRAGEWHISSVRHTGGSFEVWDDGHHGGYGEDTPDGAPSANNPTSALAIGGRHDNTTNLVGDWARILIISGTVSDANNKAIHDYLSEEYALQHNYYFDAASLVNHEAGEPDHCAFSGMCVAPNGDLVVGYTKAESHVTTHANGGAFVKISNDNGATWGSEITVWHYTDDGGGTDGWGAPAFTVLPDNRILVSVGKRESDSVVLDGIGYFTSNDNGKSWAGPTIVDSSFTESAVEGGGILRLTNGDLLFPHYGKDTGDSYFSCRISRSQDGGVTWAAFSEMADGETANRDYAEPGLTLLDNGDILGMIRRVTDPASIRYVTSDDSGATWSALTYAAFARGRCQQILLDTGEIVDIQRNLHDSDLPYLMSSLDGGITWQLGHLFETSPNFATDKQVYGQIVQHGDGNLYCSYSVENTGGLIADVMFAKTSI